MHTCALYSEAFHMANVNNCQHRLLAFSVISVVRPLDYEQVHNGVIYLIIMAKDAGIPALNSTVPITIEVFVSTSKVFH